MYEYKLTNKAVADLSKNREYIFEVWTEKQADKYYDDLISNCEEIAENPNLGKTTKKFQSNFSELKQTDT